MQVRTVLNTKWAVCLIFFNPTTFLLKCLYKARKVNSHVYVCYGYRSCLCFYDFSIRLWNCSDVWYVLFFILWTQFFQRLFLDTSICDIVCQYFYFFKKGIFSSNGNKFRKKLCVSHKMLCTNFAFHIQKKKQWNFSLDVIHNYEKKI
jgi:hypothetical protein